MQIKKLLVKLMMIWLMTSTFGCIPDSFKKHSAQQFNDQHFKTAIALIELHKLREGVYPESLDSIKYLGDWDKVIYHAVEYTKLENGYELNLADNIWGNQPVELQYPADFWRGLGLKKSNVMK
jgi:hypothetical protein